MNDDISIDTITLNLSEEDDMAYIINSPTSTSAASWVSTAGTSSVWLTANSAGSASWVDSISGSTVIDSKALTVKGDAEFEGDVKIQGKSLSDTLENIEKRLAILHPNKELEEKWERLKSLGDMYRELEAEIIEKEQIWATLKK
jgi:hypothetical protein